MSELRSTEAELRRSAEYINYDDTVLLDALFYWKEQQTNPERTARQQEDITRIVGRLACEIGCRGREVTALETQFKAD